MNPVVSVIICTFNRVHYLFHTLQSLRDQTCEKDFFEILIIDAGSTDATAAMINQFSGELGVRIIPAPGTGLSEARNIGISEAKGGIIAYLDDDAVADPGWIVQVHKSLPLSEEKTCACGGRSLLLPEAPLPPWLNGRMLSFLGLFDYGDAVFFMDTPDKNPAGLNMAFQRQVFDTIGTFDTRLGRSGGNLLSNEEVAVFWKMRQRNMKILYNPQMLAHHYVPPGRLSKEFFYERYYWQGRSDAVLQRIQDASAAGLLKIVFRLIVMPLRPFKQFFFTRFVSREQRQVVLRCSREYDRGYLHQVLNAGGRHG